MTRSEIGKWFAAASAVLAGGVAGAQAIQPGEWSSTTTILSVQGENLPPASVAAMKRPMVRQACIAPDKAAQGIAGAITQSAGCQSKGMSLSGGVIDVVAVCSAAGETRTVHAHGPFSPTAYNLNVTLSERGRHPVTMTMTAAAKRVGACH